VHRISARSQSEDERSAESSAASDYYDIPLMFLGRLGIERRERGTWYRLPHERLDLTDRNGTLAVVNPTFKKQLTGPRVVVADAGPVRNDWRWSFGNRVD
jgi:hypothetical protein